MGGQAVMFAEIEMAVLWGVNGFQKMVVSTSMGWGVPSPIAAPSAFEGSSRQKILYYLRMQLIGWLIPMLTMGVDDFGRCGGHVVGSQ